MAVSGCPVIVNTSFSSSSLLKTLEAMHFKIKLSKVTEKNSILFPTSGLAFLIYCIRDFIPHDSNENDSASCTLISQVVNHILKFASVNRNTHLIVLSSLFGKKDLKLIWSLENAFYNSGITLLLSHNTNECVEIMTSVAQLYNKEFADVFTNRFHHISHEGAITTDQGLSAFEQLGWRRDQCIEVLQRYHNVADAVLSSF